MKSQEKNHGGITDLFGKVFGFMGLTGVGNDR